MLIRVDNTYSDGPSIEARSLRVAAAYREEDEARRAYLDHMVKVLGKCRFCGAELTDVTLARTPGVCARRCCRREAGFKGMGGA
jgi:hypothetical protein